MSIFPMALDHLALRHFQVKTLQYIVINIIYLHFKWSLCEIFNFVLKFDLFIFSTHFEDAKIFLDHHKINISNESISFIALASVKE